MEIDKQTIRSVFAESDIIDGMMVCHDNGSMGLSLLIERLVAGINATLLIATKVEFINEELLGLKDRYEENCSELDMELARIVETCKHPSWKKCMQGGLSLPVCNICSGLVEEEICSGN